jgi:hypothetical protein
MSYSAKLNECTLFRGVGSIISIPMKLFLIGVFGWGFGKNGRFSWYLDGQNVVCCW